MPIAFSVAGISASGTDVAVALVRLNGARDPRLIVHLADGALVSARTFVRPTKTGPPALIDDGLFANMAPGNAQSLLIPGPVEWLEFRADAPAGAHVDVSITTGLEP